MEKNEFSLLSWKYVETFPDAYTIEHSRVYI